MLNDSGPSVQLNNVTVNVSQHVRMLGVHLSSDLSLDKHVSSVSATCFYHLRQLRRIQRSIAWHWFGGDTRSHLRDVACRPLQCNPRRSSNTRQATMSVKHCSTSCQRHQEVWSGTITTDAPGVTLTGHSRASKLQPGSADPPVSARQGANVPIKLLHSSQSSSYTAASTLRCTYQLTVPLHRLSTYGRRAFAVAGPTVFNTLPDDLRDPAVSTSTFGQSLKTHLFSAYQHV